MSHALQVSFRRLLPSELLVALAAERYKQMRSVLSGPGECMVSLETREHERRPLAHATVEIHERGGARAEAFASHRDPQVALRIAFEDVQQQLGVASFAETLFARAHRPASRLSLASLSRA